MTTSAIQTKKPIRKALAYGVHLFTATGAVWGFLTLLAIWEQNIKLAIIYIIIAMFVDGFDGMLARWVDVKTYAKEFDGAMLDNIIDYITYVVVASLLLIRVPNILPAGFEMAGALSILLTSVIGSRRLMQRQMTISSRAFMLLEFPCTLHDGAEAQSVDQPCRTGNLQHPDFCACKIRLPQPHCPSAQAHNLCLLTYMAQLAFWALLQYPDVPVWAMWASFIYIAYYMVLSLLP